MKNKIFLYVLFVVFYFISPILSSDHKDKEFNITYSLGKTEKQPSLQSGFDESDEGDEGDKFNKVNFLTTGEGTNDCIFISGLKSRAILIADHKSEDIYDLMIEKMYKEVSELIRSGFGKNYNVNKYKGFIFSSSYFDKELLENVRDKLSYLSHMKLTVHFFSCNFDKKRLRNVINKNNGFKKVSFLKCTEEGSIIPDSK